MSVHGSRVSTTQRDADRPHRPRAFVPHDHDESHEMDTLGFFAWGAFRGEWSGTSTWLADAPLPDGVPGAMVRDLPSLPLIARVRESLAAGEGDAAVLLAPVINSSSCAVLPIADSAYDVNPNYVAHIERTIPGGSWLLLDGVAKFKNAGEHPVLAYVVEGEARGLVALSLPDGAQS